MTLYVDAGYWDDGYIAEAIVAEYRRSGGWLPVIYVDKNGLPVDLAESVVAAIESAPEGERTPALEAVQVLGPDIDKTLIRAEFSAQADLILEVLRGFDTVLAGMVETEMKRARQAAIDDEVALILLMAT